MKLLIAIVMAAVLCWTAAPAFADDKAVEGEVATEEETCPGLDYKNRFSKKHIGEFDFMGGNYLGDYSQNTWAAGGRGYFHINHIFGIGTEYLYSHLRADATSSFGQVMRTKDQHIVDVHAFINNEVLFAAGTHAVPMDLFLTVGGGAVNINRQWKWLAMIGGGVKVFLKPRWMALRIDVASYIHPVPTTTGDQLAADVSFLFGLAFHFPYRPPEHLIKN